MTQEELNKAYVMGYQEGMGSIYGPIPAEYDNNEYYLQGFADGQADYDREMQALYAHMVAQSVSDGTQSHPKGIDTDTYESKKLSKDVWESVQKIREYPVERTEENG